MSETQQVWHEINKPSCCPAMTEKTCAIIRQLLISVPSSPPGTKMSGPLQRVTLHLQKTHTNTQNTTELRKYQKMQQTQLNTETCSEFGPEKNFYCTLAKSVSLPPTCFCAAGFSIKCVFITQQFIKHHFCHYCFSGSRGSPQFNLLLQTST